MRFKTNKQFYGMMIAILLILPVHGTQQSRIRIIMSALRPQVEAHAQKALEAAQKGDIETARQYLTQSEEIVKAHKDRFGQIGDLTQESQAFKEAKDIVHINMKKE